MLLTRLSVKYTHWKSQWLLIQNRDARQVSIAEVIVVVESRYRARWFVKEVTYLLKQAAENIGQTQRLLIIWWDINEK